MSDVFASAPFTVGKSLAVDAEAHIPNRGVALPILSHEWVNSEYKHARKN